MKFVIAKDTLTHLINTIQNVVGQKPSIPILSNFLIEAHSDEIVLTATDLVVGIRCFSEAKILEEGAITLPAKRFFQLTRELTASNLEMTSHDGQISELVAGSSRFKIHGMNKTEFPSLPDMQGSQEIVLAQKDLKEVFYRTSFAASREDSRYVLTGVLLQIADKMATFVGTDGKRLAEATLSIDVPEDFIGEFVIPLKAVEEITKSLEDSGDARVKLLADKIAVEIDKTVVVSKLLSGEFPDFKRIIPQNPPISVELHREELISLLRQIALFTSDTNQPVRFIFSDGQLMLTANHITIGEGKVSMPVNYYGDTVVIAFNPNFFLDILRHSRDETVVLSLSDPYNPGIVTDSTTARSVIMPMRLSED